MKFESGKLYKLKRSYSYWPEHILVQDTTAWHQNHHKAVPGSLFLFLKKSILKHRNHEWYQFTFLNSAGKNIKCFILKDNRGDEKINFYFERANMEKNL